MRNQVTSHNSDKLTFLVLPQRRGGRVNRVGDFGSLLASLLAVACSGDPDTTALSTGGIDPTQLDEPRSEGPHGEPNLEPAIAPGRTNLSGDEGPLDTTVEDGQEGGDLVEKIYGTPGSVTTYGAVGLILTMRDGSRQACSGVLLNNFVLLTAAHCLQPRDATPIGNVVLTTRITYQAPAGGGSFTITKDIFYYQDPAWSSGVRHDIAVGASDTSLGLDSIHFAMLFAGNLEVGDPLVIAGYGRPSVGTAMALDVEVAEEITGGIDWVSARAWEGICGGDSGSGGMRDSGYQDANGVEQWRTVPVLMQSVSTVDPLPGQPAMVVCNNNGSATDVISKRDWIQDIVEFWPQPNDFSCADDTNPAGDPSVWCWQRP